MPHATRNRLDAAAFAALPDPDDARLELVRGHVRQRPLLGFAAGLAVGELQGLVAATGRNRTVAGGTGFHLAAPGADGDTVRSAALGFFLHDRVADARRPGFGVTPPDLVVDLARV